MRNAGVCRSNPRRNGWPFASQDQERPELSGSDLAKFDTSSPRARQETPQELDNPNGVLKRPTLHLKSDPRA